MTLEKSEERAAEHPVGHSEAGAAGQWLTRFKELLQSGAIPAALKQLLVMPSQIARQDDVAAGDPNTALVEAVAEEILQSATGPALMMLSHSKVRRKSKKVSPLARRVWRAVIVRYATELEFPWVDVPVDMSALTVWLRRHVETAVQGDLTSKEGASRAAQAVQRIGALLLSSRMESEQGLLALVEALTSETESLTGFQAWAIRQLARPAMSLKSIALYRVLAAPNVRAARVAESERRQAVEQYERATSQVRHLTGRVSDLSSAVAALTSQNEDLQARLATTEQACADSQSALDIAKQQIQHAAIIERDKVRGNFVRQFGHDLAEAILSLDDEAPDVEMALDRLRQAKDLLGKL